MLMSGVEDIVARQTLKVAGVLQEIRDLWTRRLNGYFEQVEALVRGEWFDTSDIAGLVREMKMAAREALDGLSNDLSAEIVHASNGLLARSARERESMQEEIRDLREAYMRAVSGDENTVRRENERLRTALFGVPQYALLRELERMGMASYAALCKATGMKRSRVTAAVKALTAQGYVSVDRRKRPHTVVFLGAPWDTPEDMPVSHVQGTPSRAPHTPQRYGTPAAQQQHPDEEGGQGSAPALTRQTSRQTC